MTLPLSKTDEIPQDVQDLLAEQKYAEAIALSESCGVNTSIILAHILSEANAAVNAEDKSNESHQRAIELFITTIGYVDPAVVLHQYIAPHLSIYLTKYLMELHYRGYANQKHTQLLFNIFSQSDAYEALLTFINRIKMEIESPGKSASLFLSHFDGDAAIQVLIENQKQSEALTIAQILDLPNELVSLLIHYEHKNQEAADLILSRIHEPCGFKLLMDYGPILLETSSKTAQTIEKAAIELWLTSDSPEITDSGMISLFLSSPNSLFEFLFGVYKLKPTTLIANTFLSLAIQQNSLHQNNLNKNISNSKNSDQNNSNQNDHFNGNITKISSFIRSEQIINYLEDPHLPYDPEAVLHYCREAHYTDGTVYILEKLGRLKDIVAFLIAEKEAIHLRKWCEKEPRALPDEDWAEIFSFFIEKDG